VTIDDAWKPIDQGFLDTVSYSISDRPWLFFIGLFVNLEHGIYELGRGGLGVPAGRHGRRIVEGRHVSGVRIHEISAVFSIKLVIG
jgi:hypothetical protein